MNGSSLKLGLILRFDKCNVYLFILFTSLPCRNRQKAGPWELASLTRRREPASPVTRTRRQMKRPTAQHGDARMKRDIMVEYQSIDPQVVFKLSRLTSKFSGVKRLWRSIVQCTKSRLTLKTKNNEQPMN